MPHVTVYAEGLCKAFHDRRAIEDVSFEVFKGELFGFIGPDGAGKTTLFRILATLLLADKGHSGLLGLDTVKEYRKIRRLIGYMPGRFSLYMDLSVEENLNFYARVFGTTVSENYALIRDIFEPLEPFRKRLAGKLSGGMKQKLALSCALIHKPGVIFLDEPTTGVDAVSRKEFWNLLAGLREQGITILVSTPYMDEAGRCDRVALMQDGKLMKIASPEAIIASYSDEIFEIRTNDSYGLIVKLRGMADVVSANRFGDSIHVVARKGHFNVETMKEMINKLGFKDINAVQVPPGMEDCFLALMPGRKSTI